MEFPPLCEVQCNKKFGLLAIQKEEEVVIEVGAREGDRTHQDEGSEQEVRWEGGEGRWEGEQGQGKVRRVSGSVCSE